MQGLCKSMLKIKKQEADNKIYSIVLAGEFGGKFFNILTKDDDEYEVVDDSSDMY